MVLSLNTGYTNAQCCVTFYFNQLYKTEKSVVAHKKPQVRLFKNSYNTTTTTAVSAAGVSHKINTQHDGSNGLEKNPLRGVPSLHIGYNNNNFNYTLYLVP